MPVLSPLWTPRLPGRRVDRVILHWTAGSHKPSALDRAHYHFLIDGDGEAHPGARKPGLYLPHTRGLNTGSVGLALCGMHGATERGGFGSYPISRLQWERAAQAAAELVVTYGLDLTPRTVLCHSEVTTVYGIRQRGKWDVDRLPFHLSEAPAQVHARFRRTVGWYVDQLREVRSPA